jgi:hypothetical protein
MNDRSKRQSFLGEASDAIFANTPIAIIGLCGGGSHIAQQLAHVGFLKFHLFDHDRVERPNLNRMVGSTPKDVDRARVKIEVIRDQILRIQPDADVKLFPYRWQERHHAVRSCSIVFGGVDSFAQRDELEAYSRRFLMAYIDVGMDVHEITTHQFSISGQVIASLPEQPCMRCMGFITESRIAREAQRYGAAGDRPQVVWPNGVLASTAVGMAIALLTPWRKPQEFIPFIEYDGNRHELRPSNVLMALRGRSCPHYTSADIGDPFWQPEKPDNAPLARA